MRLKRLGFHPFQIPSKTETVSGKAAATGVWILVVLLYLLMAVSFYFIWQRANQS